MMRARSNPAALPAGVGLAVAGLAFALAGCGGTRACRDGTLFVTVDFVADAVSAQKVSIDVKPEGAPLRTEVFDHAPGATEGTIEVDFPGGYTSGNRVTLVLVGRKNGLPFAATTASVVLASGCSSTTVQLGGTPFDGGNGDAGGDAPTGAGGAGAGGSGGAGAGGSGGTGAGGKTDGGAAGAGAGGAIDSGVDTTGCVFQSAEDCFNGIDDDCNGHTDCDDPVCNGSTTCIPAAGSMGFVPGAYVDPSLGCPVRFDAGESTINAMLKPGAGCTGCSCDASVTCSANLYKYASQSACNLDLTTNAGALAGGITATLAAGATTATTSCLASTFDTTTEARASAYVTTNGPCVPSGTVKVTPSTWGASRKFCSAGSVGGGCSPGYVCVPKAAPNHCVMAPGTKACPAGYTKDPDAWYTGFTDTRSCSACSCGTQTSGSCTPLQVAFYLGATTTCTAGINHGLQSNTKACNFTASDGSAGFTGTPTAPVCPPVSTLSGALTPTGAQTLCCF
jgi:hypothetical protein